MGNIKIFFKTDVKHMKNRYVTQVTHWPKYVGTRQDIGDPEPIDVYETLCPNFRTVTEPKFTMDLKEVTCKRCLFILENIERENNNV